MSTEPIAIAMEVSVVIPCLNEAETLAACIRKATTAMQAEGIVGEVIVADNGSTDESGEIAISEGARLVSIPERGYGAALMGGIEAARGKFVVMGDADESYDFGELPRIVTKLRDGYELVQGCRLEGGGGQILAGAMPWSHHKLGNPFFSWLARHWFHVPVHDVYCGLRGFSLDLYRRLDQRCTGMEFATEMIIKASLTGARIVEVPITLHPDGRRSHAPHLKTIRDGWRTLHFFLMCTPRRLFLIPGMTLIALGVIGYGLAMPGVTIGPMTFDAHTLLFSSLAIISGYQSLLFAVLAKTFAVTEGLLPVDLRVRRLLTSSPLERGLAVGVAVAAAGGVILLLAVNEWRAHDWGELNYAATMRLVVPGVTLSVLGYETVLGCLFLSLLTMRRR